MFTLGSVLAQVLVALSKQLKQRIQIELNNIKNPNWPEAKHLFISVAEDLNSGLQRNNLHVGSDQSWI